MERGRAATYRGAATRTSRSAHRHGGLGSRGCRGRKGAARSSLHAKVIAADRRVALLGSANLTGRALTDNVEIGVILRDRPADRPGGSLPAKSVIFARPRNGR
ncbi:phospholipase D-like domain-containing protein [Streptomyces sp. NPDC057429]|uniref:phospholipase D-like domain-containing protein n=1 Tax=Streptomyces sp. NPDC057429 TaxID=3346130 RepID=UPI00368E7778